MDGKSIPYPHKMSVRGLNVAGSFFRNFTPLEKETVGVIRHLRQPGLQTIIFKSTQINTSAHSVYGSGEV